jgi:hypothetical protein
LVPGKGLEPSRLFRAADFESAVSTIPPPRQNDETLGAYAPKSGLLYLSKEKVAREKGSIKFDGAFAFWFDFGK